MREVAFAPATSLNRDAYPAKVTNDHPLGAAVEARYGAPYLTLHRGDLHDALHRRGSGGRGASRHETDGHRPAGKAREPWIELSFADGTEIDADVVIGADGVHSAGARLCRRTDRAAASSDALAYRTTFPASRLRGSRHRTVAHEMVGNRPPHRDLLRHRRSRRGLFHHQPARAGRLDHPGVVVGEGRLRELREAFASFHPDVRAVLAAARRGAQVGHLRARSAAALAARPR